MQNGEDKSIMKYGLV